MPRDIITAPQLGKPIGNYSYGTRVRDGTLLFMAGIVPVDNNGQVIGKGDLKKQITKAVENVEVALEAAGARLEDIINKRVYATVIDEMVSLGKWRCENFPGLWGNEPGDETGAPGTLIGVTRLGWPEFKVEIEVVAHLPEGSGTSKTGKDEAMGRDIITVPKLGKPIGNYSYGTRVKGGTLLFMAGIVPVDNNGQVIGKGDLKKQITQIVENIKMALEAAGAKLEDIVFLRAYTTAVDEMVKLSTWRCENFPELWGKKPGDETAVPSTLIGVTRLGWPEFKLEIEVVAHRP